MQIFIDSSNPREIKEAFSWGVVDGVTTNPSSAAKVGLPYQEIVEQIFTVSPKTASISLEVTATDFDGMVSQARRLAELDPRVVVKVPCIWDGIRATKQLTSEGIKVNVTLVFTVSQAILAAKAGAFYCSPFIGRLNDKRGGDGDNLAAEIVTAYETQGFETKMLYASVRDVNYVEHAAIVGAPIVTVPFPVLDNMIASDMTVKGLKGFLQDWEKSGLRMPA